MPTNHQLVKQYPTEVNPTTDLSYLSVNLDMSKYPAPLEKPPVDHPEIQKVMNDIDWSKVPNIEARKVDNFVLDRSNYDSHADPDCWWSVSTCKRPKVDYLPEDIYYCPRAGDWGLNYDDGPYKKWFPVTLEDKAHDQPRFYNYLLKNGNQKATLFFVGSNVIKFPDAAQRALNDGHTICSHTWSHPQMTTLTNEEVIAQLYWTLRAIKEVTGVTPKCWRPPYGDVDDRVRAIAWQMGMRTFLWDQDSFDWNLHGTPAGGTLSTDVVNGYFQKWVDSRLDKGVEEEHGHITLEHENSNATIEMAEKWLPVLQKTFNVMPIHQCIGEAHPYWEEKWTYPTLDDPHAKLPTDGSSPSNTKEADDATFVRNEDDLKHNKKNYGDSKSSNAHVSVPNVAFMALCLSLLSAIHRQ
ncbi:hypothetical protein [Absidia glauca]|uniref:NodB homology domain-containing protein n=1 Tax=Absidia glauca TaxID=4829 RepID=A0A163JAX6_ABSGL|nr:hypothetical protein [Absidia glauca]